MPLFREHRGGLSESMATLVEVEDLEALTDHIAKLLAPYDFRVVASALEILPYGPVDERNGWHTHIVKLQGYGVVGFLSEAFSI
jgi:hypothetical protein